MPWLSHRKEAQLAHDLTEQNAGIWEKHHGRPLTASELRKVNQDAKRTAREISERERKDHR